MARTTGSRRPARRARAPGDATPTAHPKPVGRLVGQRIAALRKEKRLTLESLAGGTGLNVSFLSKLERGQTSISVDNLRNVAHFLGVEMVHFFERDPGTSAIVTRRGTGTGLAIAGTDAFGESLISTTTSSLQATLYRTPCGQGRAKGFTHPGEEFVFVIRGKLRYFVGDQEFVLAPGDSIWHRSSEPHGWRGLGRTASVSLHVNTPPVW